MPDKNGYAVFLYPKALEALGDAITPYLREGPAGTHVVCREVDTAGSLIKMTLDAKTTAGDAIQLELMVPTSMVLMIVSARSDEAFGFGPRIAVEAAVPVAEGGGSKAQVEVEAAADAAAPPGRATPATAAKKTGKAAKARKPRSANTAPEISRSRKPAAKRKASKQ